VYVPKRGKDGWRRYGADRWGDGILEVPGYCVAEIPVKPDPDALNTPYQCYRPRGHGPGGLFCKQHAKMAEAENWTDD
jgi:hypothetical protein